MKYCHLPVLMLAAAACCCWSAVAYAQSSGRSMQDIERISEMCRLQTRQGGDFMGCLERHMQNAPPRSESSPVARPSPPVSTDPLPRFLPTPPAIPDLPTDKECADLARYRDTELYALWDQAMKSYPRGRVFQQARGEMAKLRQEVSDIAEIADHLEAARLVAQAVKLSADATMDLLKLQPGLNRNPAAQLIFKTYDDVRRHFQDKTEKEIHKALEKFNSKEAKLINALVYYVENTKALIQYAKERRFKGELEQQIRQIDSHLANYDRTIWQGPIAADAVNEVKNMIDMQCGMKKNRSKPTAIGLP